MNTFGSSQAIFNTYLNADHVALIEQEANVKLAGSVYIECGVSLAHSRNSGFGWYLISMAILGWLIHNVANAQAGETKYIEESSYQSSGGKVSTGIVGHTGTVIDKVTVNNTKGYKA